MAEVTHVCQDCETGACPCGATCEGCDHTGVCSTCGGTRVAAGPAPAVNRLLKPGDGKGRPNPGATGHRWSTRPPMPKCAGCDREHRYETPYYGLDPDEVHEQVNQNLSVRARPRCARCGFPFGSVRSRFFAIALQRGAAELWTFSRLGVKRKIVEKW